MNYITSTNTELLPTSVTSDKYPIHKWFNFVAGYSPEYVEIVINEYIKKHRRMPNCILDPFAGCATTSVVSNKFSIQSVGIERNPFFYKIGYTKVNANKALIYLEEIVSDFRNILLKKMSSSIDEYSADARKYLLKLFTLSKLRILLYLRKVVESYRDIKYYMGYTFLSKILEYATTAKTDGIYKAPTSIKNSMSLIDAIEKAKSDILYGYDSIKKTECNARYIYDSCIDFNFMNERFDLVIFSPPYLNNFDFAEMTRMQLYFWGDANSWSDISDKYRNKMLTNTTTALKLVKSDDIQEMYKGYLPIKLQNKLSPIVSELKRLFKEEKRSKDYYKIVYPYLGQMSIVLSKCFKCLNKGGEIHIVISDAAFYGIHIDTQDYIKDILMSIGASPVNIARMRDRGTRWILEKRKMSTKKLGEFEVIAYKD